MFETPVDVDSRTLSSLVAIMTAIPLKVALKSYEQVTEKAVQHPYQRFWNLPFLAYPV